MKKFLSAGFVAVLFVACAAAFGGSEDKFLKKYAMMKIYESCFGSDVVKQIRKEMKAACAKCATLEAPTVTERPQFPDLNVNTEPANSLFHPQLNFEQEKLNQAILAYRPMSGPMPSPSYRPYSPVSGFYPFNNPVYQQPMFYPAYQQNSQYSPYSFPLLGQPLYSGNRISRDLDVRTQIEALTSRMSGKIRNVTCVMQELGYLDENLEPNYSKISQRISNLPVTEDLKRDMQDGVTFCQQFSQCVPEIKKDHSPLSRELLRPMFFFKCYKHKKLEACVMKDVREKYAGVSDEELDEDVEFRRQGKSSKFDNVEIDAMASSMFDLLYANEPSLDIENIF